MGRMIISCLVGRDQGWELRNFLRESRVTIHKNVPSLSSGVRASATYLNDFRAYYKNFQANNISCHFPKISGFKIWIYRQEKQNFKKIGLEKFLPQKTHWRQ